MGLKMDAEQLMDEVAAKARSEDRQQTLLNLAGVLVAFFALKLVLSRRSMETKLRIKGELLAMWEDEVREKVDAELEELKKFAALSDFDPVSVFGFDPVGDLEVIERDIAEVRTLLEATFDEQVLGGDCRHGQCSDDAGGAEGC